jgi:cobalt/nickel transport system permease protein
MHIPDGLMDPVVAAIGLVEFLLVIGATLFISRKNLRDRDLPRIAVLSAGIFVAQMVNFPIGGGTTGHLIGGALFAIMVGPAMAMVGMTVVLMIQALMFGDGGITAFGLNAVNMAVIAPLSGWGVFNLVKPLARGSGRLGEGLAVAAASWASVFVAAAACAAELSVSYAVSSGTYGIAATVSVPAMLGYNAVIGVGEAIITTGVVAYLHDVSPETFSTRVSADAAPSSLPRVLSSKTVQATIAVLIVFALALPFYFLYASAGKDGLEQTMTGAGVNDGKSLISSPFSYGENYFAVLFAGIIGFLLVALIMIGILRLLDCRDTS